MGFLADRNRRLVSLVGKVPVYRAGDSGSIPDRTNTQGLKIIDEKVLMLFLYLQIVTHRLGYFAQQKHETTSTRHFGVVFGHALTFFIWYELRLKVKS